MIAYYILIGILAAASILGLAMGAAGLWATFSDPRDDGGGLIAAMVGLVVAGCACLGLAGVAGEMRGDRACSLRPASLAEVP